MGWECASAWEGGCHCQFWTVELPGAVGGVLSWFCNGGWGGGGEGRGGGGKQLARQTQLPVLTFVLSHLESWFTLCFWTSQSPRRGLHLDGWGRREGCILRGPWGKPVPAGALSQRPDPHPARQAGQALYLQDQDLSGGMQGHFPPGETSTSPGLKGGKKRGLERSDCRGTAGDGDPPPLKEA